MTAQRLTRAQASHRRKVRLGAELEMSLAAYAGAAVAAGVGLLALTSSAEAKIVYTPANVSIPVNGNPILLDLNHDGTTDFSLKNVAFGGSSIRDLLQAGAPNDSNRVWGRGMFTATLGTKGAFAWALHGGYKVGPSKSYFGSPGPWLMAYRFWGTWHHRTAGQWLYTEHRYLGLKFMISGQVHYGWARFNVTLPQPGRTIQATLTGYAYETVPNKPIITGKTKGPDVVVYEPASLGRLAQGASGSSAWRTKPAPSH
jgi:hypothetical protein